MEKFKLLGTEFVITIMEKIRKGLQTHEQNSAK